MKINNKTIMVEKKYPNITLPNRISDRIKLICVFYNINKTDIQDVLKIKRSTYYYKEVYDKFSENDLDKIIKHFNIDKQLLDLSINSWIIDFV